MTIAGSTDLSPARPPLRIALVDEPELVTAGVASMLERHRPHDGPTLRLVEPEPGSRADLVLCDPVGRADPPEQYLASLTARFATPLVAFTWTTDPSLVRRVLAGGARAWVPKTASSERLVEALTGVYAGSGGSSFASAPPAPAVALSRREREVLALICRGHSNAEIAEELYVSVNSVKTYVRQVYQKTGVSRRAQAVAWGLEHGF